MTILYTIGYEGTDIGRFVRTLQEVGVEQLADVRAVAVSRKKGFSKSKLSTSLEEVGIRYCHFVDLGDPKPGRNAARSGNYGLFRSIYGKHLESLEARDAITRLVGYVKAAPTCLLCFERDPSTCHRRIVAQEVSLVTGFQTVDLFGEDPSRYVRHASKLPRFYPCEGSAAA